MRYHELLESEMLKISSETTAAILTNPRVGRGLKISPTTRVWRGIGAHSGNGMASYGLGLAFRCSRVRTLFSFGMTDGVVCEVDGQIEVFAAAPPRNIQN